MDIVSSNVSTKSTQTSEESDALSQEWLLMRGAQDLRKGSALVDVTLIVGGVKLPPCHKFVLASSSPYFRAMFTHGMREQYMSEIEIKDVDGKSLRLALEYLYGERISLGIDNVQGLMAVSSLLQITGLYAKCRDFIIRRLEVANCISVYQFARSLCCTKLEEEAFCIISRRFCDVAETCDFLQLSKSDLINVISSDNLWVTKEETVYEAVLAWLSYDIARRGCYIAEIFSHIRFCLMDEEYLNTCIAAEGIFTSFPQLQVQIEAAQSYLGTARQSNQSLQPYHDGKNTIQPSNKSENGDSGTKQEPLDYPSYLVPIEGSEGMVRIPLITTPRAGMATEEMMLFTNGRKTFLVSLNTPTRYYGCVDGKPILNDANSECSRLEKSEIARGYSSDIPMMKNPEVHCTTDGTVFLVGGLEVEKIPSTTIRTKVYTLQPESLEWKCCSSLPNPRCMAAYGDGCDSFYVFGGKALTRGEVLSTVHKYNRIDNVWEETNSMPVGLYGHTASSLHDKIYIVGGKTQEKELSSATYYFDCTNHQWTQIASLAVARFLHGATACETSGEIFVVGGSSEDGVLSSVEVLNILNNKWRFGESFPGNRCAQAITSAKKQIISFGGYVTEREDNGKFISKEMHDVFILESTSNQWKQIIRRVKGTTACTVACTKVRLNCSKMFRARTSAE